MTSHFEICYFSSKASLFYLNPVDTNGLNVGSNGCDSVAMNLLQADWYFLFYLSSFNVYF